MEKSRPLFRSEAIKMGQLALAEKYPEIFTELDIETEEVKMKAEYENRQRGSEFLPVHPDTGQLDVPEVPEEV